MKVVLLCSDLWWMSACNIKCHVKSKYFNVAGCLIVEKCIHGFYPHPMRISQAQQMEYGGYGFTPHILLSVHILISGAYLGNPWGDFFHAHTHPFLTYCILRGIVRTCV